MTTTILLARHGETDWNSERRWQGQADTSLNDTGRRQARELAATLAADPPWALLYSSDLSRASETGQIIATVLQLPLQLDPRLREIDVGEWSGLTSDEVERRHPEGARRRRNGGTGWESGETYEAMAARVLEAVHEIAAAHRGERVVVVTHGGPMRAVWRSRWETGAVPPPYGNCAVEEVVVRSGRIEAPQVARIR
jgi:probable phosphoglycerate mutase